MGTRAYGAEALWARHAIFFLHEERKKKIAWRHFYFGKEIAKI